MIARTWRGWTTTADAATYLAYLERTGLAEYRATEGNRGAMALLRAEGDSTEFLLISFWDSMDAVRRFAGDDPERAVFYPEDDRFLVQRELHVSHYDLLSGDAVPGRG
ncbi:MAG: antibiotic biosynthesis monooxygenase family protein [Longimicrobiales bacterium]